MPRRRPRIELRIQLLGLIVMLFMAALVTRLWWLQVARGAVYTAKLAGRSEVTVRIPSVRGEIRDRNGIPLVQNRASYGVDFYLPDMVRGFKSRNSGNAPTTTYQAPVRGMMKKMIEADIVKIVNTAIVPRLNDLDLARDYNARRLKLHYRTNTEVPFTYLEDVDFRTIAKFSEHDVGLPGVDIAVTPVRQYRYGAMAAHLLGYVGAPRDISKLPDVDKYNFYQPDVEGKSQIEAAMDKYLRGKPGVRVMQRSVKGVVEGEARVEPPEPGSNVYLTIDARIQFIVEKAMRAVGRGAAVVVDPNNGDILAMCSVPSYDPNIFIPSISEEAWEVLRTDETDPLTNRALSGYAPGSIYKVVTSLAGYEGKLTPGTHFTCSGGVTYGNKYMKCWIASKGGAHGSLTVATAIKNSCNAFYYQFGNAAGIDNILKVGKMLGLGEKTGVPLTNESGGVLPGPAWLRAAGLRDRWSNGHTANVSIGQGYVLASPLQMAMVAATVANGGTVFEPRLVDRVLDQKGNPTLDENGKPVVSPTASIRAEFHNSDVSPDEMESIRKGMWMVVNEDGGTARRGRLKDVEVAGKTGTAQFMRSGKKDNHTWFMSFAPYENPRYAICVFVQGAKAGGLVPAPIAAKIYEEIFALEKGEEVELARLEPAPGSFRQIDSIDFGREIPAAAAADEETADHSETQQIDGENARSSAQPDIRPQADAQGRVIPRAKPVRPRAEEDQPRRGLFDRIFRRGSRR